MEVVSAIRQENMFTFPVLSYSLLYKDGEFVDKDFARWCSDHNCKWNDSNFFVSGDVTTLSNCPLSGDTKILYWSDFYQEYKLSPIKEVYFNKAKDEKNTIKVLSNGKEVKCKINQFDIPIQYEIELVNGASIKTTANHLNKIYGKDFTPTKDLTTNDYLPYSLHSFNNNDIMNYEDGKIVGMFLGDGSYKGNAEIVLSLNKETDRDDIDFVYEYCTKQFGAKITTSRCISQISNKDKCVNININSPYLRGLVEQFVIGNSALSKKLSYRCLNCSLDFRKGILDGLYTTDGGNSNRIYTSSSDLKDSIVVLLASMGMVSNITTDNREGRLGQNVNYVIRYYTPNNRKILKDVYIIDEDYMWIKIKSIKKIKPSAKSYCLEVLEDVEPIFMLGNGIVTHNCRLLSDTTKLKGFINSIGGTALSIGSVKVNTINLVHIFYELGEDITEKKYLNLLKKRTTLCCKVLDRVRYIIQRNIEKGLLPNYCDGGIEMDKQYCTVGILGLYEVMEKFGYITTDEFGNKFYSEEGMEFAEQIFNVLNETKDNFTDEYSFNIESVPAERAAVNLCAKDNALFDVHEDFIYSNQWIPLTAKCTINEKIRTSAILDNKCSGGAIAHINIDSNFANKDMAWDMLNYIASKGVIYFCYNTRINVCKNHHGFVESEICPECGEQVYDTYQRVVGFLTPSKSYSKDRYKEFTAREWYDTGLIYGETSVMGD